MTQSRNRLEYSQGLIVPMSACPHPYGAIRFGFPREAQQDRTNTRPPEITEMPTMCGQCGAYWEDPYTMPEDVFRAVARKFANGEWTAITDGTSDLDGPAKFRLSKHRDELLQILKGDIPYGQGQP